MIFDLMWILFLVVTGGLLGGYLSGPLTPRESQNGAKQTEYRDAGGGGISTKLNKFRGAIRPIIAGVAGAIVAVAFASGLVEHQYKEISWDAQDSAKFVGGVLKLLAVAILGGYLGVRLIDQIAERLLAQEIRQAQDQLGREINIERTLRQTSRCVQQGFPRQALQILDDFLNDVPHGSIKADDLANLRVFRGYVLKRLGRLDEAQREVDESLRIKPTYAGWYNKACYTARANPVATSSSRDEVKQALFEARRLAELQGGTAALAESLKKDRETDGDLHAFKDADFIQKLLDNSAQD